MADGVVPSTFQFQPTLDSRGGANANTSAPRLGILGGRPTHSGAVLFADDNRTTGPDNTLSDFIAAAFEPKIKAMQQKKFFEGYAAAAGGKAVEDINAEEPWYSRIFGPTPYKQGSDVFAVQKAAGQLQEDLTAAMPELRQRSPAEFQAWMADKMVSLGGTGDVFTDAVVTKTFMDAAAPMIEMHTKQHFQFQQEQLAKGQYDAWVSGSRGLQALAVAAAKQGRDHPGQEPDPEKFKLPLRTFLQSLQSPAGQTGESYEKTFTNAVETMADNGDWYTIRAIEGAGYFKQLSPEAQDRLGSKLDASRQRFKKRMSGTPEMVQELSMIAANAHGAASAEDTVARMTAFNETYKVLTGDDMGYFDIDDYVKNAETAAEAYYRAWEKQFDRAQTRKDKAETEAAKVAAEAESDALLAGAVSAGSIGTLVAMKNVTEEDGSVAFNAKLDEEPQNAPRYIVSNYVGRDPYRDARLQTRLQNEVTRAAGEEWTSGFQNAVNTFKSIRNTTLTTQDGKTDTRSGAATARAYYGDDLYDKLSAYVEMTEAGGVEPVYAYRRVFGAEASYGGGDIRGDTGKDSQEIRDELTAAVDELNPGWWAIGQKSMGASANNVVLDVASRYYERIVRNDRAVSKKDAAAEAVRQAQVNGLEISGRYAWQNLRGQTPLHKELGMEPKVFASYFDEQLTARLRKQGMSVDADTSVSIIRISNDKDGNARLAAQAYKDGKVVTVYITEPELRALRDKKAEADIARQQAKPPVLTGHGNRGIMY